MNVIKRKKRLVGSFTFEFVELEIKYPLFGNSVTDKNAYRPNVDEVHLGIGNTCTIPQYDFKDGVDTGVRYTVLRDLGADRTEIDAERKRIESEVLDKVQNSLDTVSKEMADKKKIDDICQSFKPNSSKGVE